MSANTSIEWTGRTWNPIAAFLKVDVQGPSGKIYKAGTRGWFCVKVSPGCAHCYAEGINLRLGNGLEYMKVNLDQIEWRLVNLEDPLRWKKPQTVFVDSMSDLFFEAIPDEMIDHVFAIMALAQEHTFQVLTKRVARMRDYISNANTMEIEQWSRRYFENNDEWNVQDWPLPNVWLGVSVEDQIRADERIPLLLQTPAAIRFLSCEPLLGPVDLLETWHREINAARNRQIISPRPVKVLSKDEATMSLHHALHWIIVGGESGRKARPCDVRWVREIVGQCQSAGVPVFVKQLGRHPFEESVFTPSDSHEPERVTTWLNFDDDKGGNPNEWPADLRIREFPKLEVAA